VGYELYLLPVPPGADVEETAEALLARMAGGHEPARRVGTGAGRAEDLARLLLATAPDLSRGASASGSSATGPIELRTPSGLVVGLADRFATFLVPFVHEGDVAQEQFRHLFRLAGAVAGATGWRPYDPQEGTAIELCDAGCDAALLIYLSVMDQLRPSGVARHAQPG
jgi:hypothetical protein